MAPSPRSACRRGQVLAVDGGTSEIPVGTKITVDSTYSSVTTSRVYTVRETYVGGDGDITGQGGH